MWCWLRERVIPAVSQDGDIGIKLLAATQNGALPCSRRKIDPRGKGPWATMMAPRRYVVSLFNLGQFPGPMSTRVSSATTVTLDSTHTSAGGSSEATFGSVSVDFHERILLFKCNKLQWYYIKKSPKFVFVWSFYGKCWHLIELSSLKEHDDGDGAFFLLLMKKSTEHNSGKQNGNTLPIWKLKN